VTDEFIPAGDGTSTTLAHRMRRLGGLKQLILLALFGRIARRNAEANFRKLVGLLAELRMSEALKP